LKYRLPPARVLELGSGPGAFVALLQKAGYEASGLELDEWIVNYSRQTFGIKVYQGPIETQTIQPASLDIIVLMDVLEHLYDPQATLEKCTSLLKPDGILVMQTPLLPNSKTYHELLKEHHPFLRMLVPKEHIHLFSEKGIIELYARLHLQALVFEPAFFEQQDMFTIASRSSLIPYPPGEVEKYLLDSAEGRFVLALLDLDKQLSNLKDNLDLVEADRAARLELINHLDEIIQKQNRVLKWLPQNIVRRAMRRLGPRQDLSGKKAEH